MVSRLSRASNTLNITSITQYHISHKKNITNVCLLCLWSETQTTKQLYKVNNFQAFRNLTSFWNSQTLPCTWSSSHTLAYGRSHSGFRFFCWYCSSFYWYLITQNPKTTTPGTALCISYKINFSRNSGMAFNFGGCRSVAFSTQILHTFVSIYSAYNYMATLSSGTTESWNSSFHCF